jgi:hypothetical protein
LDNVKQAFATDWVSKKAVDISNAHYVIGSKIIPDMVPSIIAFASEDEARQFMSEQGGRLVPLRDLLKIISPFGQTVPFRIPPAATPPQGVFSTALGVNVASSTTLMSGNDEVDDRRGSPKEQQTVGTNLRLLYALTDDLVMETAVTRFSKDLTVIRPNGTEFERDEAGLGDVDLIFRWRLYRDDFFDKHFALLLGTTLPTGHFEKGLPPGLQLGTGAPSLSVGPLYSQHIGAFWLHGSLVYKYNFENNDDVQSGDSLQGGVAVHYTHNYDQMVGLEVDGTATSKTQTNGADTPNTGRTNVFANAVAHWPSRPVLGRQFQHPGLGGCPAL